MHLVLILCKKNPFHILVLLSLDVVSSALA
jgi:hypothetical protein